MFGIGASNRNPMFLLHVFGKPGLRPVGPGTWGVLTGAVEDKKPQCYPDGAFALTKISLL